MKKINKITNNLELNKSNKQKAIKNKIGSMLFTIDGLNDKKLQNQLTQNKINRIKDPKTSFEVFCEKYKSIDIKNDDILDVVLEKWSDELLIKKFHFYGNAKWAPKLINMIFKSKTELTQLKLILKYSCKKSKQPEWLKYIDSVDTITKKILKKIENQEINVMDVIKILIEYKYSDNFDIDSLLNPFLQKYGIFIYNKMRHYSNRSQDFIKPKIIDIILKEKKDQSLFGIIQDEIYRLSAKRSERHKEYTEQINKRIDSLIEYLNKDLE